MQATAAVLLPLFDLTLSCRPFSTCSPACSAYTWFKELSSNFFLKQNRRKSNWINMNRCSKFQWIGLYLNVLTSIQQIKRIFGQTSGRTNNWSFFVLVQKKLTHHREKQFGKFGVFWDELRKIVPTFRQNSVQKYSFMPKSAFFYIS